MAVSRAVHSQECPLGKLPLYRNYSKSLKVLNKGDLYGKRTLRDCDQVQKEKGNFVFLHVYTSSLKTSRLVVRRTFKAFVMLVLFVVAVATRAKQIMKLFI